jgi:hypothetical protein
MFKNFLKSIGLIKKNKGEVAPEEVFIPFFFFFVFFFRRKYFKFFFLIF